MSPPVKHHPGDDPYFGARIAQCEQVAARAKGEARVALVMATVLLFCAIGIAVAVMP